MTEASETTKWSLEAHNIQCVCAAVCDDACAPVLSAEQFWDSGSVHCKPRMVYESVHYYILHVDVYQQKKNPTPVNFI